MIILLGISVAVLLATVLFLQLRLAALGRELARLEDDFHQFRWRTVDERQELERRVYDLVIESRRRRNEPVFYALMRFREAARLHPRAVDVLAAFHVPTPAWEDPRTLEDGIRQSGAEPAAVIEALNRAVEGELPAPQPKGPPAGAVIPLLRRPKPS
jgi:hypothetical protein